MKRYNSTQGLTKLVVGRALVIKREGLLSFIMMKNSGGIETGDHLAFLCLKGGVTQFLQLLLVGSFTF